jgi:hypothetical protein
MLGSALFIATACLLPVESATARSAAMPAAATAFGDCECDGAFDPVVVNHQCCDLLLANILYDAGECTEIPWCKPNNKCAASVDVYTDHCNPDATWDDQIFKADCNGGKDRKLYDCPNAGGPVDAWTVTFVCGECSPA